MRNLIRACGAPAIAITGLAALGLTTWTTPAFADVSADRNAQTVSDLYDAWTDLATTIDTAATVAQRRGDGALAQQQFLLGAMTRRAAGEFRSAEQYSLVVRIADLPAPILELANAAGSALASAPGATDASAGTALKDAQEKVNALLGVVMGDKHYPVLYGMLTRDLTRDPAAQPADLMIYGYDVRDKAVEKPPVVTIGNVELPDSAVRVDNDILLVTLPEEIKKAIGFAPSPCADRTTFGVRVRAFYAKIRGIWPLTWKNEQSTVSDFSALQTPTIYTAKATYSLDGLIKSVATESFEKKSSFVAADCEQSASTSMTIDLPPGAQGVTCEAHWVDTSSVKSAQSNCAVENARATARGTLSGLAKICSSGQLCSCVSSAHGWLEAKGTYQHSADAFAPVDRTLADVPSFAPDGSASVALPLAPNETLRGISVAFARRACPETLDALDISTPPGQAQAFPTSSRSGAFRALYSAGRLLVGSANADAFDATSNQ